LHLFPTLPSYNRFIEYLPGSLVPLCAYLSNCCRGTNTGISFVDSTKLSVCGNKRISRHKLFKGESKTGKTTTGWFHGFKLHFVINDKGELLSFTVTAGNVDDRKPLPKLTEKLKGKLFGDKGYVSQKVLEELLERGILFITGVKANMKNKLLLIDDKVLLRKRSLIKTVNYQLKNISQIEHTRHRSLTRFMCNLVAGRTRCVCTLNKKTFFEL
jgi:hypothetical protein